MPRTCSSTCLMALPFCSSVFRLEPNTLTASALFKPGLGLVHGVFRRLGVVEGDAGKRLELPVDGLDQLGLGAIGAGPFGVGLQPT